MPNADWITVKMMITDHCEFDSPTDCAIVNRG